MPVITAIEPTRRDPRRVSVYLDGEFGFAVAGEVALAAGLHPGDPIDDATIAALGRHDETHRACQAAYQFLAARPRSEDEVHRRLLRGGFDDAVVAAALTRLREAGYLDDRAFAEFWIENRRTFKPRSARLVAHELRQKGVAREVADLSGWDEAGSAQDAAERWVRSRRFADRAEFERRLGGYLLRRGFQHSAVRSVLGRLWPVVESR